MGSPGFPSKLLSKFLSEFLSEFFSEFPKQFCFSQACLKESVLSIELAKYNILVNAVSPGTINTPGVKQYFEAEPKAKEMLEKSSLLRRIGEPEEIGELVSFLLSERSSFITGQVISVDGGSSIN